MFDNIGKKIKTLSKVICWIGIFFSVLLGVIICLNNGDPTYIVAGVAVALIGILASWIGSFFAYGFGELIDKTAAIEAKINEEKPQTL